MHVIGVENGEEPHIVRDKQGCKRRVAGAESVQPVGYHAQRVEIQPRIGLIEQCEFRLQNKKLEDLEFLLLATRKSAVHGPVLPGRIDLEERDLLRQAIMKLQGGELFLLRRQCGVQKLTNTHPGDFARVLKSQKEPGLRALMGGQTQKICSCKTHFSRRNMQVGVPHQRMGERRFARTIRPHEYMKFSGPDGERHAANDLFTGHGYVEILKRKNGAALNHTKSIQGEKTKNLYIAAHNSCILPTCQKSPLS